MFVCEAFSLTVSKTHNEDYAHPGFWQRFHDTRWITELAFCNYSLKSRQKKKKNIYIYIYINLSTNVFIYIYINLKRFQKHVYVFMYVCVYVCMYVYDITRNVTSEGILA